MLLRSPGWKSKIWSWVRKKLERCFSSSITSPGRRNGNYSLSNQNCHFMRSFLSTGTCCLTPLPLICGLFLNFKSPSWAYIMQCIVKQWIKPTDRIKKRLKPSAAAAICIIKTKPACNAIRIESLVEINTQIHDPNLQLQSTQGPLVWLCKTLLPKCVRPLLWRRFWGRGRHSFSLEKL